MISRSKCRPLNNSPDLCCCFITVSPSPQKADSLSESNLCARAAFGSRHWRIGCRVRPSVCQAPRRPSSEPSHAQRVDDQLPGHALVHRKADNLTAEQIDDDRKIDPAFRRPEIGDVARPDSIRRFDAKLALEQVRRNGKVMGAVRRRLELAFAACAKVVRLHQFSHAVLASANAALVKFAPDARPTVGALHLIEDRLDVNQQGDVADPTARLEMPGSFPLTRLILMVAAGADVQHPALRRHRPDHAMSLDKGVSHSDSLAKYAAAFFRMSRSTRALASSAFRRAISICSALTVLPAISRNRPAASAFTQLCSV